MILLKAQIIQKIQNIDDENILNDLCRLLEIKSADLDSYALTDEQMSVENEAQKQINNRQFLTHEEAQNKLNQWLND